MVREEILKLMRAQALQSALKVDDKMIEAALDLAAPFVWKAYGWKFRRKEATITTTGGTEYVELPEDFAGFHGLRYRGGSSEGWQLEYHSEDTYEYAFPNPDLTNQDAPMRVKIVRDSDGGLWRAYFNPKPDTSYDLSLIYLADYGAFTAFPSGFEGLVLAASWLFIHPPGTQAHSGALVTYKFMLEDAIKNLDPIYRAEPGQTRRARLFNVGDDGNVPDDWYNITDGSDY